MNKRRFILLTLFISLLFFRAQVRSSTEQSEIKRTQKSLIHRNGFENATNPEKWAWVYGGYHYEIGKKIYQTAEGLYFVGGWSKSFSGGTANIFLMKLSKTGDILWQQQYGGEKPDSLGGMDVSVKGNCFVCGLSMSYNVEGNAGICVLELDSADGKILNQILLDGWSYDLGYAIACTSDGGCIVGGKSGSFSSNDDIWIVKLSEDFEIEWQRGYGGAFEENLRSIYQTKEREYLVSAMIKSPSVLSPEQRIVIFQLDPNGQIVWSKSYKNGNDDVPDVGSVMQNNNGNYVVAGSTSGSGAGGRDILMLELYPNGDIYSQKTIGGLENDNALAASNSDDNGYIVCGDTQSFGVGYTSAFMMKLSPSFDVIWQNAYSGTRQEWCSDVTSTFDQGGAIVGMTSSFGDELGDIFVIKADAEGQTFPRDIGVGCDFSVRDSFIGEEDLDLAQYDTNALARKVRGNIGNTDAYKIMPNVSIVFPPVEVSLRREINQSLTAKEAVNVIRWMPNPLNRNIELKEYRVHRKVYGSTGNYMQIAIIPASYSTDIFYFNDIELSLTASYQYVITAVNSNGTESKLSEAVDYRVDE